MAEKKFGVWAFFDVKTNDKSKAVSKECNAVLSRGRPATWWKFNTRKYPTISKVAQVYLAPPPTSVPSERLFSTAGDIITEHRTRLLPDNAEKLIFLKYNASLI
ncbi:hypothetical protein HELRODRAFT_170040 [Helobdella robusta]|uniref:HAT C-terminal dimerisation domain-containing protein n=1 Tax=Helobdella robusta TaxID=6412 RepID=T1F2K4_HELRO|nr:hypothetical protein HELRODRAFT_170040 [Helobdella robusta]ESO07503.1 hypothetical protein HELRODRAFT_170040 [Helobdella robusta]